MIPAGRTAVDETGAAALCGISLDTLARRRRSNGFPAPLNPHARRRRLYDTAQVRAWDARQPIPALPAEAHPDDLLDAHEIAALLGIQSATWTRNADRGHRPAADRMICGVQHWLRSTVEAELARPRNPGGAGKPKGATDRRPRRPYRPRQRTNPRLAEVERLLEQAAGEPLPARTVAAQLGISERHAERLLAAARQARAAQAAQARAGLTPAGPVQRGHR